MLDDQTGWFRNRNPVFFSRRDACIEESLCRVGQQMPCVTGHAAIYQNMIVLSWGSGAGVGLAGLETCPQVVGSCKSTEKQFLYGIGIDDFDGHLSRLDDIVLRDASWLFDRSIAHRVALGVFFFGDSIFFSLLFTNFRIDRRTISRHHLLTPPFHLFIFSLCFAPARPLPRLSMLRSNVCTQEG